MKSALVASLCASILALCLVKSTPVYPTVQLRHFSSVDACLFVCNICFDDMGPEMMDCANHVCLAREQFEMVLGLIEVGRNCKNFNKLDNYMFGGRAGNSMHDSYLENNETH